MCCGRAASHPTQEPFVIPLAAPSSSHSGASLEGMHCRGFAAAHGGKPPAFRPGTSLFPEASPPSFEQRRRSLLNSFVGLDGKPEAYRHVLRQSRKSSHSGALRHPTRGPFIIPLGSFTGGYALSRLCRSTWRKASGFPARHLSFSGGFASFFRAAEAEPPEFFC